MGKNIFRKTVIFWMTQIGRKPPCEQTFRVAGAGTKLLDRRAGRLATF